MWPTVGFRIAQAVGVTGAAWLSGNIALFSMNVVPSLLRSRTETRLPMTTLAKQWREIYETGKRQNPPIAAITAATFVYLAVFSSRRSSPEPPILFRAAPYSRAGFYASAALLTLSIVPFTLIAMSSTNNALIDVCEPQKQRGAGAGPEAALEPTDARIEELLQDWVALNWVRSLLPLIASLTGVAVALL